MGAGQNPVPPPPPPPPPHGGWDQQDWKDWSRRFSDDIRQRARGGGDWRYRRSSHHLVLGMIIVGIGLLLLLENLGIPGIHDLWRFWPVILIAVGLAKMVENPTPAGVIWGGIVAGVGTIFLLDH